ncbi:MAG: preprotein translocase subunit SecE [Chthonomonadaceae bacterium]|nr:preprotein translocase subunit SecE [Chthonomonadaceae bacterium]
MSDLPLPSSKGSGINGFYRGVLREMKHVTWPTRAEAMRLTGVVLGTCGLLALVLTGFSLGLEMLLGLIGIGRGK